MALNHIACPECGAGMKSPTGFTPGQTVCCPKCETDFLVEVTADKALSMDDDQLRKDKRQGDEQSYKTSWMRYTILGVLLAVLGILSFMLYEKKMKEGKEPGQVDPDWSQPVSRVGSQPDPNRKGFDPEEDEKRVKAAEARANLVGNWMSKANGVVRTVEYKEDGTFSYTAERRISRRTSSPGSGKSSGTRATRIQSRECRRRNSAWSGPWRGNRP